MSVLVFATHNSNKLKEVKSLLDDKFELLSLSDVGFTDELEETTDTLEGNAWQKARAVKEALGKSCFADDTGLEVEALGGQPGVKSARYAGEDCSAYDNVEKLLRELEGVEKRRARFRTVIALILDGEEYSFEGIVNGRISNERKGEKGFGYDPVFIPEGFDKTFSEMTLEEKNRISHRGIAVKKLIEFLNR